MKNQLYIFLLIVCCFSVKTNAQIFNKEVEAKIDIGSEGVLTKITFSAYNKTAIKKSLRYRALIAKGSNEKIRGENFEDEQFFIIEPWEQKNISTATLDLEGKERTIVFVLLYDDDKVIGKDRIVINGFEGEDAMEPKIVKDLPVSQKVKDNNASDIELLTGLVFENTKTKPGRDFYQMFYLEYNNNNINGNKIVRVDEELAIGGNTQIKIYAGDDLVVQFFLNPRSSYINEMVKQSLARINYYFQQNKAIRQNTIQY